MAAIRSPWAVAGLAAVIGLALLLPGLGRAPYDDPGEGQHAEIAREALASGDLLDLRFNGVRYFDKPPLLYWLIALDFSALGQSESAARLPAVVGVAVTAAATAFLGARLLGPGAGLLAAAALLSCALFVVFGRYVRPETLFVAAIQCGLTGILVGLKGDGRPARGFAVAGCAALGLAALAKDPLGLLGPLAAVTGALAACGRLRPFRRWLPPWGLLLMLVLGLGWYAWSALRHPGFLWYAVVDNHVLNAMGLRRFPDEDVPLAALEFLSVAALGAFPWIIPAGLMLLSLVRRRAWRDPAEAPWIALALWLVGLWGLFTLSAFKLPHYGLPAYPAVALLAARWWTERPDNGRAPALAHLALCAFLAAGLWLVAASDGRGFVDTVFSATDTYTRKEAAAAQASPLPPWSALQPLVARAAAVMGAGACALAVVAWRRAGRWAGVVVAATMLAVVPSATRALDLVFERPRRLRHGGRSPAARGAGHAARPRGAARELRRPRALLRASSHPGGRAPERARIRRDLPRRRCQLSGRPPSSRRHGCGGRPILLVTPRDPRRSLVADLPPERVRLLRAENGRWLYSSR